LLPKPLGVVRRGKADEVLADERAPLLAFAVLDRPVRQVGLADDFPKGGHVVAGEVNLLRRSSKPLRNAEEKAEARRVTLRDRQDRFDGFPRSLGVFV
jgi:hypothetical protein